GARPRGPLLRKHLRLRPQVRPRGDASQRPAGVRCLPTIPQRRPPRHRPVRPHPQWGTDLRHDPLRQQRAPLVRAAAIAPGPLAGRWRYRDARGVAGWAPAVTSSATAVLGLTVVTRPSPTSTASAPAAAYSMRSRGPRTPDSAILTTSLGRPGAMRS